MASPYHIGETNLFGMKILSITGPELALDCGVCGEKGYVSAAEFLATRCGSSKCGSTQGRTE
jgi:hypothetical protein